MPATATTISFALGSMTPSTGCVTVSATDDTIVEGDEDFDIVITMTDQAAVVVGASDTTTVTIPASDSMSDVLSWECKCRDSNTINQ